VVFFMQDTYNFSPAIAVTTGLRYDMLSDFDEQLNYRIGLTGSLSKNFYGKLLFGTAYRVPSYREYLDIKSHQDNLNPEKLRTLEAQVGYASNKMDVNITLYNNHYTDFISEVLVDSIQTTHGAIRKVGDEMSFNFYNRNITGLELNSVFKPTSNFHIIAGLSYKLNATEQLGDFGTNETVYTSQVIDFNKRDLIFLSDFTANFAAAYSFLKRANISLSGQYFSARNTPTDYQANVPAEVRDASNADGFIRINFYGNVRIVKGLNLNGSINNIFDANTYSPPFGGQKDYDAQWAGRTFRVGLRYNF
jgi:outer membrane receptor for ferrienterochelin and colicins